jgi:hypothetical protein
MAQFLRRYGLAIACVAAPFLLGLWASSATLVWLMAPSHVERITLDYRLRDQPAVAPSGVRPAQKAEPGGTGPLPGRDGRTDEAARFDLVAKHFSGMVDFALASGFLYSVFVVAFAVSAATILRRAGWNVLAVAIAALCVVTAAETWLVMANKQRRLLVTDNIFQLVDRHDLLKEMPVAGRMTHLIAADTFVGLFTAGIILIALAAASVRRGADVDRADLEDRLLVIRITLSLASAILVVATLSTKALVDWPLSLLEETERKALGPAGDALTRLWAASSSIALLAAFLPGIAAWYLDREAYRAARPPAGPGQQPDDGLEIAPLSTVTSILVVLAPVVASPMLDAFRSLLTAVGGK